MVGPVYVLECVIKPKVNHSYVVAQGVVHFGPTGAFTDNADTATAPEAEAVLSVLSIATAASVPLIVYACFASRSAPTTACLTNLI
jgi:hypothetical protein